MSHSSVPAIDRLYLPRSLDPIFDAELPTAVPDYDGAQGVFPFVHAARRYMRLRHMERRDPIWRATGTNARGNIYADLEFFARGHLIMETHEPPDLPAVTQHTYHAGLKRWEPLLFDQAAYLATELFLLHHGAARQGVCNAQAAISDYARDMGEAFTAIFNRAAPAISATTHQRAMFFALHAEKGIAAIGQACLVSNPDLFGLRAKVRALIKAVDKTPLARKEDGVLFSDCSVFSFGLSGYPVADYDERIPLLPPPAPVVDFSASTAPRQPSNPPADSEKGRLIRPDFSRGKPRADTPKP